MADSTQADLFEQVTQVLQALARQHPLILVLDDATSAVDAETEAKIHEALHEVIESCTSFIVAQRVSTVLTADKIVVLDDGRVSAIGTHRELMATSRIYREIYDSQLGGGPLAAAGIDRGDGGPPGGAVPEADGSESGSAASGPVDEEDGDA